MFPAKTARGLTPALNRHNCEDFQVELSLEREASCQHEHHGGWGRLVKFKQPFQVYLRKSQTNSSLGIVVLCSVQSSQPSALQTKPVCNIVTIVFGINP